MPFHSYLSTFHQMAKFNEYLQLNFANNPVIKFKKSLKSTIEIGLL